MTAPTTDPATTPAPTAASRPDEFEAFYKDVRGRLLLQTWALTGDLPAAEKAVRDALAIAWHHWSKVRRLPCDAGRPGTGAREDWARPMAWRRALRRHAVPHLPRNRNVDPEIRRTLAALVKLPIVQRKVLLLTHLTTLPLESVAREAGITLTRAEQELLAAVTAVTVTLELPSSDAILGRFEPMAAIVEGVRWPRTTILTRAGTARRRGHALVAAAAVVGAFVGSGYLVAGTEHGEQRSRLETLSWLHAPVNGVRGAVAYDLPVSTLLAPDQVSDVLPPSHATGPAHGSRSASSVTTTSANTSSPASTMSSTAPSAGSSSGSSAGSSAASGPSSPSAGASGSTAPLGWATTLTSDNRTGNGLVLPCQQARYADADARAALVRTLAGPVAGAAAADATVGQLTEASTSDEAAKAAYDSALKWYGGCRDSRVQLLDTYTVGGVGDQAALVALRNWATGQAVVVGVARTGILTTTVATTVPTTARLSTGKDVAAAQSLLDTAVAGICHLDGHGACGSDPARATAAPLPVAPQPQMVDTVDLPPVSGVTSPWVGTKPVKATTNVAATHCDQTSFVGHGVAKAYTRTFVIPGATSLPTQFGLTETIGTLHTAASASRFVGQVRHKLDTCEKRELGSKVDRLSAAHSPGHQLIAWHVEIQISKSSDVVYLMAIVRNGHAVAQLGFVPSGNAKMSESAFVALARRAQTRLAAR